MHEANDYLSKSGYEKLLKELELLKTTRRREIASEIGKARAFGDISENAEYDAAKDAQAHNEKKIAQLEQKISQVKIIDDSAMSTDEVLIGATVKIEDLNTGETFEYMLVSELEADYEEGKIAVNSPVARGLLNRKVGEIAEIQIPDGILKYKILDISR